MDFACFDHYQCRPRPALFAGHRHPEAQIPHQGPLRCTRECRDRVERRLHLGCRPPGLPKQAFVRWHRLLVPRRGQPEGPGDRGGRQGDARCFWNPCRWNQGTALLPAYRGRGHGEWERVSGGSEGPGLEADHREWKCCPSPGSPGDLPPPAHPEMYRPQAAECGGEAEKGATPFLHGGANRSFPPPLGERRSGALRAGGRSGSRKPNPQCAVRRRTCFIVSTTIASRRNSGGPFGPPTSWNGLFREVRPRTRPMGVFTNAESAERIMYGVAKN